MAYVMTIVPMCTSAVPIVVDNCGKMKMHARSSLGVQIRARPYGEPSRMSLPNCGMIDRLLAQYRSGGRVRQFPKYIYIRHLKFYLYDDFCLLFVVTIDRISHARAYAGPTCFGDKPQQRERFSLTRRARTGLPCAGS
jgi:hypothetical protein